jgi:flavin reductase (DIM6/NTAB) family NADH-FMN oxidoreductase RutF
MAVAPDEFREALANWASGVTIVACRHDGRVVATTVSAFTSLSLDPPLVLVALGPNATVLPFLQPGAHFGISILAEPQRRLATIFADPLPVGNSPFATEGEPVIDDALVALACTVTEVRTGGDHRLVLAEVTAIRGRSDAAPLIRFRRRYHGLPA